MPALVTERPQFQPLVGHVTDLVITHGPSRSDHHPGGETRFVRPQSLRPVVGAFTRVEDVHGPHPRASLGTEWPEVESLPLQLCERFTDQLPGPNAVGDRLVFVVRPVVFGPVVGRHQTPVFEFPIRILVEILVD